MLTVAHVQDDHRSLRACTCGHQPWPCTGLSPVARACGMRPLGSLQEGAPLGRREGLSPLIRAGDREASCASHHLPQDATQAEKPIFCQCSYSSETAEGESNPSWKQNVVAELCYHIHAALL